MISSRIFLLCTLFIFSCKPKIDFLLDFKIASNEEEWQGRIDRLVQTNVFFEHDDYNDHFTQIKIGNDFIKAEYRFNKPIQSKYPYSDYTLYQKGKLLSIEVNFAIDSICEFVMKDDSFELDSTKLIRSKKMFSGQVRKDIIERIKVELIRNYGNPLKKEKSIIINQNNKNKYDFTKEEFDNIEKATDADLEDFFNPKIKDFWELSDFIIEFSISPYEYDNCISDSITKQANIYFNSKDYDHEIKIIRKQIKKSFTPNDIIEIEFGEPPEFQVLKSNYGFNVYEIKQSFWQLTRYGHEEKRNLTDIKFDIVYLDRFNEEVAKIENCIYEVHNNFISLTPGSTKIFFLLKDRPYYSIKYYSNSKQSNNYELLRNNVGEFKRKGKGKIIADIKKIVFEDGSVLE